MSDAHKTFTWIAAPYHTFRAYQVCDVEGHRLSVKRSTGGGFTGKLDGTYICNHHTIEETKACLEKALLDHLKLQREFRLRSSTSHGVRSPHSS